ncbi:MAG: hypothetical protein ACOX41_02810 [Anaerovoracaceae bacterium]
MKVTRKRDGGTGEYADIILCANGDKVDTVSLSSESSRKNTFADLPLKHARSVPAVARRNSDRGASFGSTAIGF